ncbi:hypothetical protein SmaMPs15_000007 [Stenotrophomonas maltophilia phage vB_SmaM_Ps15]|uniref:Uncharacterized protein n=1 Tax=Stenotrophomonas maltophilia phage vB_SmaM_Ps15 TaxID=3071007 RepID=A0AAE9FP10_9CAUD|nr:hypothetical protein PQC01_gp007 [Stenotrophomonas maltophilia phage vB_SmaM_Ps15]UMO77158.1 hypothetical protein SmaMPs15_000007 [Stenotrophomonas maltophilia phage vB_SmaM_Ps15]
MLITYRLYLNSLDNEGLETEAFNVWGIADALPLGGVSEKEDEEARQELIERLVGLDEESQHGH